MGFRRTPTSSRGYTPSALVTLHAIRGLCHSALAGEIDPAETLRKVERLTKQARTR